MWLQLYLSGNVTPTDTWSTWWCIASGCLSLALRSCRWWSINILELHYVIQDEWRLLLRNLTSKLPVLSQMTPSHQQSTWWLCFQLSCYILYNHKVTNVKLYCLMLLYYWYSLLLHLTLQCCCAWFLNASNLYFSARNHKIYNPSIS